MITTPLLLAAAIAAITALAFWLDHRYRWASRVGATLLVIVFGAVLSNLGLVPAASPVYDGIMGPVTSLAIVWLLFAVDVRDLKEAGPRMAVAFGIAVLATATGALAAGLLFAGEFGGEGWKLAGVMTGTYAGGGLNFVAVGRELDLPPALFTAATAADNVMTALWFGATLLLPLWLRRWYPASEASATRSAISEARVIDGVGSSDEAGSVDDGPNTNTTTNTNTNSHPFLSTTDLRVFDISVLLALGFGLIWLSEAVAEAIAGVPSILWLTTFALALGHTPWVRALSGAMHLGSLGLHFFFAVLGIFSRVSEILRVGMEVFWFTALVVLIHGVVTFVGCRLARLDVETTAVASQAAVGGPSSALALAVAKDWRGLVLPGVVVGLLGYAVGNYLGIGVAAVVRAWTVG